MKDKKILLFLDNHNQTGNDVKNRLIFLQETADCSRECAEGHKGRSKACDKAESAFERFAGAPFPVWIYAPPPLIAIKNTKALENMDDLLYNAKNIQEDTPNSKGV